MLCTPSSPQMLTDHAIVAGPSLLVCSGFGYHRWLGCSTQHLRK
jgi:hypothetical protein